jgi:predicted DNA-binding transcriptional regulator AlpA
MRLQSIHSQILRSVAKIAESERKEEAVPDSILLSEIEVAKRLQVSVACVRRWRLERRGPRYLKIGSLVRYRPEDIQHWLMSCPSGGDASLQDAPVKPQDIVV